MSENTIVLNIDQTNNIRIPKDCKENRYYYRHREEILEKKRQQRLEDPLYQAKQKAKEDAKKAKEAEKEAEKKRKSEERARKKAELLGVLPLVSSGAK